MALVRNKVFSGKKVIPETTLKQMVISGGSVALAEKLRQSHGWDSNTIMAAPIAVMESGVVTDNHWVLLGSLKPIKFSANSVWPEAPKDLRVIIDMPDLTVFTFAGSTNLSYWLDREELEVSYTHTVVEREAEQPIVNKISYDQAVTMGVGEFAVRAMVVPKDVKGAGIWIGAVPHKKATIQARLGDNTNCHRTPHITLQLAEVNPSPLSKGRAVYAVMTQQEQAGEGFGFGVIPWLDATGEGVEDAIMPDSEDLRESLYRFMRLSATVACATTAGSMEARLTTLVGGQAPAPKKPEQIWPVFVPMETTTQQKGVYVSYW